jgi:hypothetical protein
MEKLKYIIIKQFYENKMSTEFKLEKNNFSIFEFSNYLENLMFIQAYRTFFFIYFIR